MWERPGAVSCKRSRNAPHIFNGVRENAPGPYLPILVNNGPRLLWEGIWERPGAISRNIDKERPATYVKGCLRTPRGDVIKGFLFYSLSFFFQAKHLISYQSAHKIEEYGFDVDMILKMPLRLTGEHDWFRIKGEKN